MTIRQLIADLQAAAVLCAHGLESEVVHVTGMYYAGKELGQVPMTPAVKVVNNKAQVVADVAE